MNRAIERQRFRIKRAERKRQEHGQVEAAEPDENERDVRALPAITPLPTPVGVDLEAKRGGSEAV